MTFDGDQRRGERRQQDRRVGERRTPRVLRLHARDSPSHVILHWDTLAWLKLTPSEAQILANELTQAAFRVIAKPEAV